jgi:CRISPR-associated protein Cas1
VSAWIVHTRVTDLQSLPRFANSWTFLYTERVRVEREDHAIVLVDQHGRIPVPAANISVLLLGPGATVTHAAILTLADCGTSVVWCGEGGVRFYAAGAGESRRASNLADQAMAWADERRRLEVVMRLYRLRFSQRLPDGLTLQQIRGMEGVRVREAYGRASRETGVPWSGRSYKRDRWTDADPVNRALSAANACLYGLCHAALVSTGYSPGLGFIHVGKMLSFVYDVADLYKCDVTVPMAFRTVATGVDDLEARVRRLCRQAFFDERLVERIIPDVQTALGQAPARVRFFEYAPSEEDAVSALWNPDGSTTPGGRNFASSDEGDS